MGRYVNENLVPNENVIKEAIYTKMDNIGAFVAPIVTIAISVFFLYFSGDKELLGDLAFDDPNFLGENTPYYFYALPLVVILFSFYSVYMDDKTREFAITNRRIIGKEGFISRKTVDYNLTSIESVDVEQSVLGRIFNFGNLVIVGSGGSEYTVKGIKQPNEFKKALNDLRYNA